MKEQGIYLPNGTFRKVNSPFGNYLDTFITIASLENQENLWEERVRVKVDTPLPYLFILPLSDIHLGHFGVDYQVLSSYLSTVKNYPITTVLVGDITDFFNPHHHPEGMQQDTSVMKQVNAMKQFFEDYQDKILAIVSDPSHTDWAYQSSGVDIYQLLANLYQIPLLQSGGILEIDTGKVLYNIALFHKIARYNSSLNPTHAGKRVLERHAEDIDIVVSGHVHNGGAEITPIIRGKKRAVVQLGTFKIDDGWGAKQGMVGRPNIFFPTIILGRDEREIEIIENPKMTEELINSFVEYNKLLGISLLGIKR